MAVIISGGDGPTPRLPGPAAKAAASSRSVSARSSAVAQALGRNRPVRNAVGGYQATGSPSIVSGGDTASQMPKPKPGRTIISGGG